MSSANDSFWGDERYKRYLEERRELNATRIKQSDEYDRSILTLSSAGIGLSIALLRFGVTGIPHGIAIWLISLSWIAFALSLVSTTFSFRASQNLHKRQMEIEGEIYSSSRDEVISNEYAPQLELWNRISSISFVAGVLSLVGFAFTMLFA